MLKINVYLGLLFALIAGMLMRQEFLLAILFIVLAGLTAHGLIFPRDEEVS